MKSVIMQIKRTKLYKIYSFLMKPIISRIKSGTLRRRSRYARYYKYLRIEENYILYEAFFGRGMLCNPYAIFSYLLNNEKYKNLVHIWVLDDINKHKDLIDRYEKYPNVKFVQYQTRTYLKYLCSVKYLINNGTFPSYFTKKDGQIYINTWHGVPLKKMGFDMPNGRFESSNVIRNLLATDYLLTTGPILTKMYTDSYKLNGIYSGEILDCGYPRLDLLKISNREDFLNRLESSGVKVERDKEIILYAPTWKGKSFSKVSTCIEQYIAFKDYFDSHVDSSKYQLLVKVHQSVYERLQKNWPELTYMVPATIDANEMLSVTSILITDYSSIFFDFLATNRPIIFYIPDQKEYQNERGISFSMKELPGSIATSKEELCSLIRDKTYMTYKNDNYTRMKQLSCDYEIGEITSNVVEAIWETGNNSMHRICCKTDKKKILIFRGRMRVNGISTSLRNLLNNIDYDMYDVSLQVTKSSEKLEQLCIEEINQNVRVLVRTSTLNVTLWEDYCQDISSNHGQSGIYRYFYDPLIFEREFKRCYGSSKFDIVIDFDGYNTYYSLIHLAHFESLKGIWMHNDMDAERELRFPWLKRQFEIYPRYDFLISCSKEIMQVNREKLASSETYNKYVYTKNMIDIERINHQLKEGTLVKLKSGSYCTIETSNENSLIKRYTLFPLQPQMDQEDVSGAVMRFITVGRLSPEKNHKNLIDAFSRFVLNGHNAILYILGDGPLKKKTAAQISKYNLKNRVIMTGNVRNPLAIMKYCDCFILPSLHEGQPMVIHEARMVGLPIIMSEFSSAQGSMIPDGQYLIGTEPEDILEGLEAFVAGKVPKAYAFDAEQYNCEAYEEFLCAIGEHKYSVVR